MKNKSKKVRLTALTGILCALALALSFAEKVFLSAVPLPMGIKPGLSNIIVMFACSSLGLFPAICIVIMKSGFALIVSGAISGMISLCGGIFSIITMYILIRLFKKHVTYIGISVLGAVMHNAGQLTAATIISSTQLFTGYGPMLLISGIIFGIVTGITMNIIIPHLNRLDI